MLFLVFVASGAPFDVDLPKSSIRIPWSVFEALSDRQIDTVSITPNSNPPVAITFGDMEVRAELHDSTAEMSLAVSYTVLSRHGWAEAPLFDTENRYALSSISLPSDDFLRSTDAGYVLTAAASGTAPRHLKIVWTVPAGIEDGVSSIQTVLPPALRRRLEISAPVSYTEVAPVNAFLLEHRRIGTRNQYRYLLGTPGNTCAITYKTPLKTMAADTAVNSEKDLAIREPVITTRQESAVFLTKGNCFAYTALHLSVQRAPVTRFTIELPDGFSLLTINGNGIRSWKQPDHDRLIEINLSFELEGHYTLNLAGELPMDSIIAIPAISVKESAHQTGMFAFCTDKETEAQFQSVNNCEGFSLKEFLESLSPEIIDSVARHERSFRDITLAGRYFKLPFSAIIRVKRQVTLPIADAVCDAGSIRTVISRDAKILTQVNLSIRHRDRQFISLRLPDSASLWSVALNNEQTSPSIDSGGRYRISLQRYRGTEYINQPLTLEITYLLRPMKKGPGTVFRMMAPVPDIPVSRLDWTVFYPDQWSAKNITGSFEASRTMVFGKRFLELEKSEQQSFYGKLRESNAAQQAGAAGSAALSLMPESPGHLYAYTILVVDEQPWMEIRFGSAAVDRIFKTVLLAIVVGIVIVVFSIVRRRLKTGSNVSDSSSLR